MTNSRRRLIQSVALAVGGNSAAQAQDRVDALREVSEAHGINLRDDRLRLLKPVLAMRQAQLSALRSLDIDDQVGI
jgi:hypothetical protein